MARNLCATVQKVTHQCDLCLQTNPKNNHEPKMGQIGRGNGPGQQWQIDFIELPRKEGYRYLLILMNTFSGWPEVFPTRTVKAREVTQSILRTYASIHNKASVILKSIQTILKALYLYILAKTACA